MHSWFYISALGGLGVTAPVCIGIAAWLACAHCMRRALAWLLLFGAAMLAVVASKIAFIGWGIGSTSLDFAGFSGHAARAGVVFPVAAWLLCRSAGPPWRRAAVALGALLAMLVAIARVKLHTHSASEAVSGLLLGLATAAAFIRLARGPAGVNPRPWMAGAALGLLMLHPPAAHVSSQQLLTGVALNLAGSDRPYSRADWKPARYSYHPPCPSTQRRFDYICM